MDSLFDDRGRPGVLDLGANRTKTRGGFTGCPSIQRGRSPRLGNRPAATRVGPAAGANRTSTPADSGSTGDDSS